MAHKIYDAVATVGKYKTADGTEKKRYLTVGAVFQDAKGRLSLKLDALPTTPDWSGWISFYQPENRAPSPPPSSQPSASPQRPTTTHSLAEDLAAEDDDMPF